MIDIRCQKLISEFGLPAILQNLESEKKKLDVAQAMAIAIFEAYGGAQRVSPNPLVGCVILDRNGRFLSKGHHQIYGQAHAEINALDGLDREQLHGATLVVTLEPCAHVGKTGSCALKIKDLPLSRVIYGTVDPFPMVSGKGAQIIKESGKEVILFSEYVDQRNPIDLQKNRLLREQIQILAENFLMNTEHNRAFVAIKWAQSIDGKMALKNLESQWITNSHSRFYAHYLRSIYDVTLVGAGTILRDNPKLNIRLEDFKKENKLMIVDPDGDVFKSLDKLEISKYHKKENIFFAADSESPRALSAYNLSKESPSSFKNVLFIRKHGFGYFPLTEIHKFCFERGMKSILVEGGPSTINQYFHQKAFDRVYSFIAPTFLGDGLNYSDQLTISTMATQLRLKSVERLYFDDDILLSGLIS